jgi:hypothetical protein
VSDIQQCIGILKIDKTVVMKILRTYLVLLGLLLVAGVKGQDLSGIKGEKPFKMSGNISLGSFFYNAGGIDARQQPYGYSLGANLNFNIYGVAIPFYASFNEQGSAFQHPFNRYGISPRYKWIQAHIGWRSMSMSQFSLSNTTFLGGGLELKPGKFRFAAMYGNVKQPAELQNINFTRPQFERRAMAVKIGVGTDKNFFDFIVFKAKDDTLSLHEPDSIQDLVPAYENLVLGVKNKMTFAKDKLVFNFDASFSAFSNNIRYPSVQIINDDKYQWVNSIFNPNISTSFNYAGETDLTYRHKFFSLGVKYRRVMPDFKSLGSEYILNDVEAVTVNPAVSLFNGKAMLSGSVGTQRNNLDGNRMSTNERMISSVNLSLNPSPYWGIMFGYSNYTFQQQVIIDSLYNDSMVINQLNQNYNVVPRLTMIKDNFIHNLVLTANYQILNDRNDITANTGSNTMLLTNLMYSMMVKKTGLNLRVGATYFSFNSGLININRLGINFGAGKKFLKNKMRTNITVSYNKQNETYSNSTFITLNGSINYQVLKKTSLGLQFYYSNVNSTSRAYNEQRVQLRVSQSF